MTPISSKMRPHPKPCAPPWTLAQRGYIFGMSVLQSPGSLGLSIWEAHLSRFWFPTLLAADGLGIFPSLEEQPATVDELSERLGLNPRALGAVLPMLASLGHLVVRGGRYHLTDDARSFLLPTSAFYWGGLLEGARRDNPMAERLTQRLTAPDPEEEIPAPVDSRKSNSDSWASGDISLEGARAGARHMQSVSSVVALGLAENRGFASSRRLLDIGGGSGCFSIALASRHPNLHCTVLDLPTACEVALEYVKAAGVEERVDTFAADMFRQPWPDGYDAILFSNIFHDWRVGTCTALARRAFDALGSGGTINLHEMLLDDDGSGPRYAASMSVYMVLGTQGQQFTLTQLASILGEAGFADVEFHATSALHSLVRARKP